MIFYKKRVKDPEIYHVAHSFFYNVISEDLKSNVWKFFGKFDTGLCMTEIVSPL